MTNYSIRFYSECPQYIDQRNLNKMSVKMTQNVPQSLFINHPLHISIMCYKFYTDTVCSVSGQCQIQ